MLPKMRHSNVLVRLLQKKTQKIGSIEIAGQMDRELDQCLVLAVGPGDTTAKTVSSTADLKPGQIVVAQVRSIRKPAASALEQITERRVAFVYKGETLSILEDAQIGMILQEPTEANLLEVAALNAD